VSLHVWILRKFGDTDKDWVDRLYDPLQRIACFFTGHTPHRDECGLPEHDHCFWCWKPMPGKWSQT